MIDYSSTSFLILLAFGLLATGAIAGILAGLLGVGGGIVIVPVLFYLFEFLDIPSDIAMHLAVATSLATIIPTSISSSRAHKKKGALDIDLLKSWTPFIFVGAAFGGYASKYINGVQLTAIFGGIALLVSLNMANPKKLILSEKLPKSKITKSMIGSMIGFLSSLMGIGGGTLSVPILTLFSYPVHRAVGAASAFGLVIAAPAVLGFIASGWTIDGRPPYSLGYVSLPAAVLIFSATIFTAPIGARIAHAINPRKLKLAFAAFLFLTALRMLSKLF